VSKLVKACSKNILLDYPSSGVFTSGSIEFIASALTFFIVQKLMDMCEVFCMEKLHFLRYNKIFQIKC